jgi:DNA-binding GntR family transcriptional regulator
VKGSAVYTGLHDGHEPSRHHTAHEFVCGTVRNAILSGRLAAGTRLVQAKLADELQVSTTPVREALRDLAAEGLIRLDPHRGAVVRGVDTVEMQEIYDLRLVLEPYCMQRAATHITEAELREAQALQDRMDTCADQVAEWVELNRRFHEILTDACRSPRLIGMLKGLRDASAVYVGLGIRTAPAHNRDSGNADHRVLLSAFREQDPEAAARAIRNHLYGTMRVLGLPSAADAGDLDPSDASST